MLNKKKATLKKIAQENINRTNFKDNYTFKFKTKICLLGECCVSFLTNGQYSLMNDHFRLMK